MHYTSILIGLLLVTACEYKTLPKEAIILPDEVEETSGLATLENDFLTHNDSGGEASLYRITPQGELVATYPIDKVKNKDWEDLAQDEEHFYIADTGNNLGKRKKLRIYIIDKTTFKLIDTIKISYADQTKFDPKKKTKYDAETLIAIDDSLVIFSKNRKSNKSRLYVFPKTKGSYRLSWRKKFVLDSRITGGDFHPQTKRLVLSGYLADHTPHLFVAENFNLDSLDQVSFQRYKFNFDKAQIEGVKITKDEQIWISSEGEGHDQAFLLAVDLDRLQKN